VLSIEELPRPIFYIVELDIPLGRFEFIPRFIGIPNPRPPRFPTLIIPGRLAIPVDLLYYFFNSK
jgi:hypothetical protein